LLPLRQKSKAGKAAGEASTETPGTAPASGKLLIPFGELGRKPACAPRTPVGRLGAGRAERRGTRAADKPNSLSLGLSFGDRMCRNQSASQRKASAAWLYWRKFSPQSIQPPAQEKSSLLIIRLSTNIIYLP